MGRYAFQQTLTYIVKCKAFHFVTVYMRQVRDDVSIGDMMDAEQHGDKFDTVLSLASAQYTTEFDHLYHYPLIDGDNEYSVFAEAVDMARKLLRDDGTLLVHCQAGASRSVTVLATALAAEEERSFQDTLFECQMKGVYPSPELLHLAKEYLPDELYNPLPFKRPD